MPVKSKQQPQKQPRRQNQKGGTTVNAEFIGAGTTGVLIKGDALAHMSDAKLRWITKAFRPSRDTSLVSKVMTDKKLFEDEVQKAEALEDIDPSQKYFLYPFAAFVMPADNQLLASAKAYAQVSKLNVNLNPDADIMYVLVMQDGGKSVYQHNEKKQRLNETQAKDIIRDLHQGLEELHKKGYIHGDAHVHNAVIILHPRPRAYWIDFGKMAKSIDHDGDKKDFYEVAKTVFFMADMSSEQKNDLRTMFQIPILRKTRAVSKTPLSATPSIPKRPRFSNGATLSPKKLSFF